MTETITAIFARDLRTCDITVVDDICGGFTYRDLAVKQRPNCPAKGDVLLTVLVPCERDIGWNLMVAFDLMAAWGYRRSGRL